MLGTGSFPFRFTPVKTAYGINGVRPGLTDTPILSYVIPQPKEDKNYQEAKGKPRSIARIILI